MGFYPYPAYNTGQFNRLYCLYKGSTFFSDPSFKDRKYLSGRFLNQQPSTRQACASIELSVWRLAQHVKESGLKTTCSLVNALLTRTNKNALFDHKNNFMQKLNHVFN